MNQHVPEISTVDDIWDEEEDNIISIYDLKHKFPLHGNRKIDTFHKIISKLKDNVKELMHNASNDLPLPLIIKRSTNHYIINAIKIYTPPS